MTDILHWPYVDRPRQVVRSLASLLHRGGLVAFPTDASFVVACAARLCDTVLRLRQLTTSQPIEIVVSSSGQARDWVPGLGRAGHLLMRRFWPGPLTLASRERVSEGLVSRLPPPVRTLLLRDQLLHLRHPAHEAIHQVARRLREPLLCCSLPHGPDGLNHSDQVLQAVGAELDLLIDDQPTFPQNPTVIEVQGADWSIRQQGPLSAEDVSRQLACLIVFVCTGNTCRSPMAEGLCKKRLAEKLACSVHELPQRGFLIVSAGLAAGPGFPAANEAIEVARALGADLTQHESRPLTFELASRADHLLVMTRGHERALAGQLPPGAVQPRLLSPQGEDIVDPIGGSREVYEHCARQMDAYLEQFVEHLICSTV